ncbi:septum formation protein [Pseudoalteromonas sp. BSi20652]|uniref:Maf family protein n=1 Tax=Pseudoalteromonas sp. BSi20652 TaxID=388384 RepID=UPI0002316AA1|nr:nucleoside triphosphate pyrophosphatase [Pseudoalteromonas sp. BSi20652]GAA59736.1 septum formation protein [Pseudoalteromonas sp. BSi20652]
MTTSVYLASASPRRKELLSQLGIEFTQFSIDADESPLPNEQPRALVERLARLKAISGVKLGYKDRPVLGSDTVVVIDNESLGKPRDEADFTQTLKRLSGNTHQVLTAVAFATQEKVLSCVVSTDVTFKALTDEEIKAYWLSGEPQDKAGGYGIQGLGGRFVTHISGSYFCVVGLPLYETEQLLHAFLRR